VRLVYRHLPGVTKLHVFTALWALAQPRIVQRRAVGGDDELQVLERLGLEESWAIELVKRFCGSVRCSE
jgi:hypothetical protein